MKDCLQSASFADEVIVVDSIARDDTAALAKAAQSVVQHEMKSFAAQRTSPWNKLAQTGCFS